jgi:hypothetical protein
MEQGINMSRQVELKELIKVEAKPEVLNDVDKWMVTVGVDDREYRVAMNYNEIETSLDVITLLSGVLEKIEDSGSPTNHTEEWKGAYQV